MEMKMLGVIFAGFASPVDEDLADVLRIEDYLIRDKDASFLLQMQGDSMISHGICDGDIIIFERGADTRVGDLVVILTSDGYRVAFLSKNNIGVEVIGLVVSIVRKYK
jgi:DNA polymerase V